MRRFGFLLSRRWVLFGIVVVLLVLGTWWLGNWQFDRLDSKKASNAVISANEHKAPAPVAEVMSTDSEVSDEDEWRMVSATGTYDVDNTVVVRYRTRDESAGVDVVVPLITEDGTALLVDRGWMPAPNNHAEDLDIPAPPPGEVEITGYLRADGSGSSTDVTDLSTRAVSAKKVGEATGLPVYDGFVELDAEDPEPAEALAPEPLPELDNGPHFFYGLQWWFFGVLAVTGFLYLLYDEWRTRRPDEADGERVPAGPPTPDGPDGSPEPAGTTSKPMTPRQAKAAKRKAVRDAYKAAYEKERAER
ncbi:SURF1 family protein [Nocardioides insulae]|uniref:SURF1 family cytochrome oxidase biogenesis protein n=1 Tax=Nocardioides insulae TaxID=394734 RepID=UPI0003F9DFC5|nr:SURF1 family protein [Nocardioides insulae]